MEALAVARIAPGMSEFRRLRFPHVSLSWIRVEFVLLTGALIMAG